MLRRSLGRALSFSLGALTLVALPGLAAAKPAESVTIQGTTNTLSGDQYYDTFTVMAGATLHVLHLAADGSGGRLSIHANQIIIQATGSIEADGAGSQGTNDSDGASPVAMGGGLRGMSMGDPGGGGAYSAAGGQGYVVDATGMCQPNAGSAGGKSFFDATNKMLYVGAAGGAANGSPPNAGGAGGGIVELIAAKITIDGTVSARGASRDAFGGVAPGGGSGGSIHIATAALDGAGVISVAGGDGKHAPGFGLMKCTSTADCGGRGTCTGGMCIMANDGGGGSGGVVLFSLPSTATLPTSLQIVSTGGASGAGGGATDCMGMAATNGQYLTETLPGDCVDADGDGVLSSSCSAPGPVGATGLMGGDCDDADKDTHPGAKEVCDGRDNDCNDAKDDGDDLCPAGETCSKGACVEEVSDAGSHGASDAGSPPDYVRFDGGCDVPPGLPAEGSAGALVSLMVLVGARSRRRRA